MEQAQVDAPEAGLQWVTFRLGDETYAFNVLQVREVLRVSDIAPVPGAPDYVLGIVNLRGNIVTVIDAGRRLGLPDRELDEASRIVVVETGDQVVGILVDGVAEVLELQPGEIESAPNVGNDESSKYIQGVATRESEVVILVDVEKLLTDEEWMDVASL